jgi:hypothetical protein
MKYRLIPNKDSVTNKITWIVKISNQIFGTYSTKTEATLAIKKLSDFDLQFK